MSGYEDLARLVTFRPLEKPIKSGRVRVSPFGAPWTATVELLARELKAHGAQATALEIDVRERDLRQDGMPRANVRAGSPGIVLSFKARSVVGEPQLRYEVATFSSWQDNVRAVALGLEKLRAVDRYGITKRGEQYAGWRQLSTGTGPSAERGRDLIARHGGLKGALQATHPDLNDGADADFKDVIAARDASA